LVDTSIWIRSLLSTVLAGARLYTADAPLRTLAAALGVAYRGR
jgi:hypothetical protein